jgi:cysteine desulfurase
MGGPGVTTGKPVYLDFNATTPTAAAVLEMMLPWFSTNFGNASSTHPYGQVAAAAVANARAAVAQGLGVPPSGIIFTSGATEANNLAIRGVHGKVVVTSTEHKAVLDTARSRVHAVVPVDSRGRVDLGALDAEAEGSSLISVMMANNETGVLQDLGAVVEIARRHGCLVHTDATQAFGKLPMNLVSLGVDLASVSAHKIYGPKGVGALYVRRGVTLESTVTGGGHERGLRSGTSNVPGIVGFGAAVERIDLGDGQRLRRLIDELISGVRRVEPFEFFSDHHEGLPNTLSIRFSGADAEAVMANCPNLCISTGSACTASTPEPSHVLQAMGVPASAAYEVLRISVGAPTTAGDVAAASEALVDAVRRVRTLTVAGHAEIAS